MTMRKIEDSWMNPHTSISYTTPPPKNGTFYVIERKKRVPVSGNVAFLERWGTWEEYKSKEDRDAELARLRETTSWVLRGRVYSYVNGQHIGSEPTENMDF